MRERPNFLVVFIVLVLSAMAFGILETLMGKESYAAMAMGLLLAGIVATYMRKVGDLAFWIILTFAGRALDDPYWLVFITMVFGFILVDSGIIGIRRK